MPPGQIAIARCKVLLLVTGCLCMPVAGAQETVVSVVTIQTQPVAQRLRATGSVTSPRSALLSTAVGGLIQRYTVDIGAAVAAGDKLVELDAELARLELDGARASEVEAQSALQDARRRLTEAERLGGESGVIAATEIESRRTEVAVLEASLAVARATVRQREAIVARNTIRAPFNGVVSERLAEVGEWVNPGDPLLQLVATANLQFDFRLPQSAFSSITAATPIKLSFDALPGIEIDGRITAIVPVSNPGDRTFMVRVTADEPASPVRIAPGMSARAEVVIDTGRNGVMVPRDAMLRYPDGRTSVWIVQTQSDKTLARERLVKTGLEFDGQVEITSGLEPGLRVVVRGNEALRDGQTVAVR